VKHYLSYADKLLYFIHYIQRILAFVRNRSKSPRLKSHFWSCFSNPTGNYLHSGVKRKLELNWSGPTERKIISLRLKGDVLFQC